MTLLLSILLIALGLLLWVAAGILPVAKLQESDATVILYLETTWMGVITLSRRNISGVRDARFVQDPNSNRGGKIQVRRTGAWETISGGFLSDALLLAQLAKIIRSYIQNGGPPLLSIPMRGRMNLMLGFAVFFPLGTTSIFTGILLLTNAL